MCDNLNTHTLGALYLVLPPEEARRQTQRFCLHPTPTHASWLNMAELERQCLDRRIGDLETLRREVAAWVRRRNEAAVTVHWPLHLAAGAGEVESVISQNHILTEHYER